MDDMQMIPFVAHEAEVVRLERIVKKLWILALVIFSLFVLTNAGWIWYESQFETVEITQEGDTDSGGNNYFNGTGEMTLYGQSATGNQDTPSKDGR